MVKSVLDFGRHKTPIVPSVYVYALTTKTIPAGFIDMAFDLPVLDYATLCSGLMLSLATEKGKNPHCGGKGTEKNS